MSKIEKRICVGASVERLFTYVPESNGMTQLWPGLLEVGEVEHLPNGGALARWLYKLTGVIFEDWNTRCEPLVDQARTSTRLGNMSCAMKWSFHANTRSPQLMLDGDHTFWSLC